MTQTTMPTKDLTGIFGIRRIVDLHQAAGDALQRMPWCHRVLLENVLRQPEAVASAGRDALLAWLATGRSDAAIPFAPGWILMHDTTCGPALTDIAGMRDALAEAGGDPELLNPDIAVATSTDHSVGMDYFGTPDALARNMALEMERSAERYQFMKWASGAVRGFRVFPPGTGIMHTINLERLASVVVTKEQDGVRWAMPDTMLGTDSHTPMINALGVLGWGVGGIEAEGVMFNVPITLRVPDVLGVRLLGKLPEGTLATDLALMATQRIRQLGISGEFVEFFGPGVGSLNVGERAVAANMAVEYGATTGCFPIDDQTLDYLRGTGRTEVDVALVEAYARANGLWYDPAAEPRYTDTIEIDLATLRPTVSGPRRPQDRMDTADVTASLTPGKTLPEPNKIPDGAVAIAAIASCTNTSDFGLLAAAGLLARKARALGLHPAPWVKTTLTPGSPAASLRLRRAGLLEDLEALGFAVAGYGCATCIGHSGPLVPIMEAAVKEGLIPVSVISSNRNFPGRIHSEVDQSLLMSPPMVVAYALAGHARLDVERDPLTTGSDGKPVYLAQLWPTSVEIAAAVEAGCDRSDIPIAYDKAEASETWAKLEAPAGTRFPWNKDSTYLRRPPFARFATTEAEVDTLVAHPLLVLGDDITTDHISPAGAIPAESDAGKWLIERDQDPENLDVYASHRGNWEVMLRGLFTNRTVVNHLVEGAMAGQTVFAPTGEALPAWQAAARYIEAKLPVVLVAGERYGTGSSRDWAAKGELLLGVRAVLANSFERIHRTNLIGMGLLPLQLPDGWRPEELNLAPGDTIEIGWKLDALTPQCEIPVTLHRKVKAETTKGVATALLDTEREVSLIQAQGIIPMILDRALKASPAQGNTDTVRRAKSPLQPAH